MSTVAPRLRLFFALLPDAAARERAAGAADAVPRDPNVRCVAPKDYHVTLAFIGDIAAEHLPTVIAIGRARRSAAFTLRLDAYGYWRTSQALVVTASRVPPALLRLRQELHADLAAQAWAPIEPLSFRPHITVLRKVTQQPVLPQLQPVDWVATSFCLMRSEPGGVRSTYTVVDTWPLLYDATTP